MRSITAWDANDHVRYLNLARSALAHLTKRDLSLAELLRPFKSVELRKMPSRPREFHPEPLTDPDLILSHHPARAIDRRLPPSVGRQAPPVASWPDPTSMTCPLRSNPITGPSPLLRGSPPLSGASVLSASRLEPLVPFPLASPARFSRSV